MNERQPGQRPPHVQPPEHLSKSPPVPEPRAAVPDAQNEYGDRKPTRYGDWELNGIAIDF